MFRIWLQHVQPGEAHYLQPPGMSPTGQLLAAALGSAAVATTDEGCVFVFAEQDPAGVTRWATARQLPAAWPQSTASAGSPVALTRTPLAPPARAR